MIGLNMLNLSFVHFKKMAEIQFLKMEKHNCDILNQKIRQLKALVLLGSKNYTKCGKMDRKWTITRPTVPIWGV